MKNPFGRFKSHSKKVSVYHDISVFFSTASKAQGNVHSLQLSVCSSAPPTGARGGRSHEQCLLL